MGISNAAATLVMRALILVPEVAALQGHQSKADAGLMRVQSALETPLSEVDPLHFQQMLETEKTTASPIISDLSDGKRRVNATKGPKKRKVAKDASFSGEDSG